MFKKYINYIDLGVHNGQEIDLFLEQFQGEENYQVNIFGVEANKLLFNNLSNKYQSMENIKIFHCAISDKNEPLNLYLGKSDLGSSVFPTKTNLTDINEIVRGITFHDFIELNIPSFKNKDSYNILKLNI